jgi:hypothetical protein
MKNIGSQLYFFVLIVIAILVVFSFIFKSCFAKETPAVFQRQVEQQPNPFTVHRDSAAVVWRRAGLFFEQRRGLISGGTLQQNDTMFFLPYYNDHHKGDCVKIVKREVGDSIEITCTWWYGGDSTGVASKEIALFLQNGIGRYGFEK